MNKPPDGPPPAVPAGLLAPGLAGQWLRAMAGRLAPVGGQGRAAPAPPGERPVDFVDTQPSWHGR